MSALRVVASASLAVLLGCAGTDVAPTSATRATREPHPDPGLDTAERERASDTERERASDTAERERASDTERERASDTERERASDAERERASEAVPPADLDPAPADPTVAPRALAQMDGRIFGCVPLATESRRLLRRSTVALGSDEPIPSAAIDGLAPQHTSLTVLGPEGPCVPRLGSATFAYETTGDPIVGQAIEGCGRSLANLALADCEVPTWLRWLPLEAHIEHLPRRGPLGDPMLEALVTDEATFALATDHETAAERRARLRRRVRRSVVRTEREELLVLEVHRFLEGSHPCAYDEDVHTSVHVRRIDGEVPGPWETLHPRGRVVGAYVDDGGWFVALDTVQSPAEGSCEVDPGHMLTCDLLALEARSGETLATASVGYAMNATFRGATSLLAHARECSETGY